MVVQKLPDPFFLLSLFFYYIPPTTIFWCKRFPCFHKWTHLLRNRWTRLCRQILLLHMIVICICRRGADEKSFCSCLNIESPFVEFHSIFCLLHFYLGSEDSHSCLVLTCRRNRNHKHPKDDLFTNFLENIMKVASNLLVLVFIEFCRWKIDNNHILV